MSERHVETSRRGFELFETGDIDALIELYAEDAEIHHPEGWPEPGPTRGRTAVGRQFEALREGWSEHRVVVEEIEGRGEWVVARVLWRGRGSESGVDVEVRYSAATRFDDERIAEVHYCWQHDEALQVAGWKPASA